MYTLLGVHKYPNPSPNSTPKPQDKPRCCGCCSLGYLTLSYSGVHSVPTMVGGCYTGEGVGVRKIWRLAFERSIQLRMPGVNSWRTRKNTSELRAFICLEELHWFKSVLKCVICISEV